MQKLRRSNRKYDGFYLAPPKSRSSGTLELDPFVAEHYHHRASTTSLTGAVAC